MSRVSTWDAIRNQVRDFRSTVQAAFPVQVLFTVKDFCFDTAYHHLYFLSNGHANQDMASRHPTLYKIDYACLYDDEKQVPTRDDRLPDKHIIDGSGHLYAPALTWTRVYTDYATRDTFEDHAAPDQSRLCNLQGITHIERIHDRFVFTFAGNIFVGDLGQVPVLIQPRHPPAHPERTTDTSPRTSPSAMPAGPFDTHPLPQTRPSISPTTDQHARTDPKLGGCHNDLVAFIRDQDIWVTTLDGEEIQLTFCVQSADATQSAGTAEYIMQEEFHRYTGYYWEPLNDNSDATNRIVYLQTSEHKVDSVRLSNSTDDDNASATVPMIRYPRAGRYNATSSLRIVEFTRRDHGREAVITEKGLWKASVLEQLQWAEYIVRFGWLPTGNSIWAQLLSRDQTRTMLVKIPCSHFAAEGKRQPCDNITSEPYEILWEESSPSWINVTDVYYFFKQDQATSMRFIWSSEQTGYRHLYLVTCHSECGTTVQQLTHGDWCVVDRPIYVDERRELVYFMAKRDTPLEAHLYVTSLANDTGEIVRLTHLGFSHNVTMDPHTLDIFVDCYSNLHNPQCIAIRRLIYPANSGLPETAPQHAAMLLDVPLSSPEQDANEATDQPVENSPPTMVQPAYPDASPMDSTDLLTSPPPTGQLFDFVTLDGVRLYGCLYKPHCYQPGRSYPTLLHIYGGPKTQMVMNEFKFPRLVRYLVSAYFGFAVLMIDGRGSCDRGLSFESHLRHRLGTVEMEDQIQGLRHVYDACVGALPDETGRIVSVVDMERIAITGWSYGGYLSLIALARYASVFKMAIAGAPVTLWEMYDSAYTERYLGLPGEHGDGYTYGSVLHWVKQFPDDENRLIIAHGLLDENVHYRHTELLVDALKKHHKPHFLQVYPTEKHGLRHASVNEHFETLMFYWLVNHL